MGTKAQLEETQAKSPGVDHWELGWIMLKFKTPLDDDIWDYSQPLMDIKRNIPIYIYRCIWDMWDYSIQDIGNTTINPLLGNHISQPVYRDEIFFGTLLMLSVGSTPAKWERHIEIQFVI